MDKIAYLVDSQSSLKNMIRLGEKLFHDLRSVTDEETFNNSFDVKQPTKYNGTHIQSVRTEFAFIQQRCTLIEFGSCF